MTHKYSLKKVCGSSVEFQCFCDIDSARVTRVELQPRAHNFQLFPHDVKFGPVAVATFFYYLRRSDSEKNRILYFRRRVILVKSFSRYLVTNDAIYTAKFLRFKD